MQLHHVPSENIVNQTELDEELNMDLQPRRLTKDGGIAHDHPAEFYENDRDNDARDEEDEDQPRPSEDQPEMTVVHGDEDAAPGNDDGESKDDPASVPAELSDA